MLAEKQQGVAKRFVTLTVDAGACDAPYMSTLWQGMKLLVKQHQAHGGIV